MQAEAGHMSLTGEPGSPPMRYGLSIVDLMTGLAAAFGLLSGVLSARATGAGMDVDASLFDVALHNLNYPGTWFLNAGVVTERTARSSHPSLTPSQLYRTRDGWIFIMCNKEKFWGVLAEALGRPEWASDPDFATFKARLANRERVTQMLDAVLTTRTGLRRGAGAAERVRRRARRRGGFHLSGWPQRAHDRRADPRARGDLADPRRARDGSRYRGAAARCGLLGRAHRRPARCRRDRRRGYAKPLGERGGRARGDRLS
jgi:hypothetical protein